MFYIHVFIKLIAYLMAKKKIVLFFSLIFIFASNLKAQMENETTSTIILSLGPAYCSADTKESPIKQNILNNKDITLGFRMKFPNNFGCRTTFSYITFTGSDGASKSRSYSFSSKAWQLSVVAEYAISIGRSYISEPSRNSVYFFIGMGLLNCIPKLDYYNRANYQYKTDANISPIIPLGFGYQHDFNNNFQIGVEYNLRWSFSDYLDGFKPPYPESKSRDMLQGFSITLGYRIM